MRVGYTRWIEDLEERDRALDELEKRGAEKFYSVRDVDDTPPAVLLMTEFLDDRDMLMVARLDDLYDTIDELNDVLLLALQRDIKIGITGGADNLAIKDAHGASLALLCKLMSALQYKRLICYFK